jgi:integrase
MGSNPYSLEKVESMRTIGLTARKVATTNKPGRYADGHGLILQVQSKDSKSWLFRYERGGRERWMGLGPVHTISLADARERALKARRLLLDGIDPLDARKAEKAARALEAARAITFERATRDYFDQHEKSWKNGKHAAQFLTTLETYAFPVLGKLPVAAIDTSLILKVLEPIWPTITETASRVRGRIEAVLNWATVRGYRSGENPARWKGHLAEVLPARGKIAKIEHHAALAFDALPAFAAALRTREGIAARALEFTILTAARTGEVIGATWDEIDLETKTWTVPAGRMKAGKEHRVPLSDRAVELLKALPREDRNPFVFIGSRERSGLSNMAMTTVLRRMGADDITVHGFRSTFRDWAAERSSFPNHVVEMALAHGIENKVEEAYRRGDLFAKRRQLMAAWAKYTSSTPAKAGDNVVAMRSAG